MKEKTFTGFIDWLTGYTGFNTRVRDQWVDPYRTGGTTTGVVTSTRVGIGVTNPQEMLDVS